MGLFDIFKISKIKVENENYKNKINLLEKELNELKTIKYDIDQMKYKDIKTEIYNISKEKEDLLSQFNIQKSNCDLEIFEKKEQISKLNQDLINLDEDILMQSFGFYNPKYDFEDSDTYKNMLDDLRKKQRQMVKNNTAVHFTEWFVNGSKKDGKKMTNDMIKLTLRAFNLECDNVILKAKFNNIDTCEKRLDSAYDTLNKLGRVTKVTISSAYLKLKFEELYLAYEYAVKKQEEKEEQKVLKERMREEAKVLKELELAKKKIEKEELHFTKAISDIKSKLSSCSDTKKVCLLDKLNELEKQLEDLEKSKEDLISREQNTRAGYVYVISNIGSFGDDVYKVGMTRRLEPLDRVSELSSASVPFSFDVHAMIFSDNAPTLESQLHNELDKYRVNKVNNRKEFFRVSLNTIEKIVKENHNETIEFTKLALAEDYRKTLKIIDQLSHQ